MSTMTFTKSVTEPPISKEEILRYAGCKMADDEVRNLLDLCIKEARSVISYKVCYALLPLKIQNDECDFSHFKIQSSALSKNLEKADAVIVFAATAGVGIDRLISRYTRLSPAKAAMLQAFGSERVEALCDAFLKEYESETGAKLLPRFSPGYADLPLEVQKDIFALLDVPKYIGASLNDSLLMSPSKSVTAFAGLVKK